MKPLLFLDVDGVVFPYGIYANVQEDIPSGYVSFDNAPYGMVVSENLIQWTRDLNALFSVHWCTSWDEKSLREVMDSLNLPRWPYVCTASRKYKGHVGKKVQGIRETLDANPRAWVWIDDQAPMHIPSGLHAVRQPHLIIRPERTVGLTQKLVNRVIRFASKIESN